MVVLEKIPPQPTLDSLIAVADELAKEDKVVIEVASSPLLIGEAINIEKSLRKLYPFIDTYVKIKNMSGYKSFSILNKRKDIEHYTIQINIDGKKRPSQTKVEYSVKDTTLSCKTSGHRISVTARNLEWLGGKSILREKLKKYLPSESSFGLYLHLEHENIAPFVLMLHYQNLLPLKEVSCSSDRFITFYPVSNSSVHELDYEVWRLFQEPIYWDSRGQWAAQTFSILTGHNTEEDIAKRYKRDDVKPYLQRSKILCYKLMDPDFKKEDICKWFSCPETYDKYFLLKPIKSLRYFANPSTINSSHVQNLVNYYNEEYAVHGKSKITPEKLCIDRYNALSIQNYLFETP